MIQLLEGRFPIAKRVPATLQIPRRIFAHVVALAALLSPHAVKAVPADDWAHISVCNASTKISVYVAQAYQFNWGRQYEVSGWTELGPSAGLGVLGRKCMTLAKSMATPVYFTIAHRDENGKMALYNHELREADWGTLHHGTGKWYCVDLTHTNFRYTGRDFDDLSRCPEGGTQVPFPYLSKSSEGDENFLTVDPTSSPADSKLANFDDIARGRYGAVAVDERSNQFGWAADRISAAAAGEAALEFCAKPTCKVVATAQAKCISLAQAGVNKFRVGTAPTQNEAMALASTSCSQAFGACKQAIEGGCSGKD